jgi:Tfp pilus assembly protein PilF
MLRPRSIGLLLGLLTLLVYLPATSDHFINFDDPDYVTDNHFVQNGLTWTGIKWAFSGAHASNWHPLTWLSHMADCDLFRQNPAGPHLVNILFHAANTSLLFVLIFQLTKKLWPSAFVAALFAWHPLHVESVAWVAERKDVLSTFFALLSLICYVRYVHENRRRNYYFAAACFVLALLSKPMPVTLPLVMLLLDFWPLKRWDANGLKAKDQVSPAVPPVSFLALVFEKWPFFLLAAASCVVTFVAQHQAVSSLAVVPFDLRLENAVTAYAGYLGKMVWPLHLAIFYPLQTPIAWSLVAESMLVLTGVTFIVWRFRKICPGLLMGWLWFLVTLVPVIGLVQVGAQSMADRYSYFPLIGIFLALAFSAQMLIERFRFLGSWYLLAATLILGMSILMTENQLRYWRDSETLFSHSLAVTDSATAHASLAGALQGQNRTLEATRQYIMAIRLDPELDLAYWNLAKIFGDEGKLELAAVYYREGLKRKPQSALPYDNLGVILVKLKRPDEALKEFAAAAQADATAAEPHFLMGRLLLQRGKDEDAVVQLRQAMKLDPNNAEILIYSASVLAADENAKVRNGTEALRLSRKAVSVTNGQQPAAFDALAMSNAEAGDFGAATLVQMQAIKLAQTIGHEDDIAVMQEHLKLYAQRHPWRESFSSN